MARVKGDATKQCCSGHWVSDQVCEGRVWNCQTLSSESKGKRSSFSGYEDETPTVRPASMFKDKRYYVGIAVGVISVLAYFKYVKK